VVKKSRRLFAGRQRSNNPAESARALRLFTKASRKYVNDVLAWCDKYGESDSETWTRLVQRTRSAVTILDSNTNLFETTHKEFVSRIVAFRAYLGALSTKASGIAESASQSTERLKSSLQQVRDSEPSAWKGWLEDQQRLDEQFLKRSQLVNEKLTQSLTLQYDTMSLLVMWIDLTMTMALSGAKTIKVETPLGKLASKGLEELPETIAGTVSGLNLIVMILHALRNDKWISTIQQIKRWEQATTDLESLNKAWKRVLQELGTFLLSYQVPEKPQRG
jgi:hypothetical protein